MSSNLVLKNAEKSSVEHTTSVDTLPLSLLNEIERLLGEGALTEKELHVSMISVVQEKAPGIDELTKEFYS